MYSGFPYPKRGVETASCALYGSAPGGRSKRPLTSLAGTGVVPMFTGSRFADLRFHIILMIVGVGTLVDRLHQGSTKI